MTPLSEQLRDAIRRSGLTPYRIADELGLPRSTLSRFLGGAPIRTVLLDRIGELLGLRITMELPPATKRLVQTAVRKGPKSGR